MLAITGHTTLTFRLFATGRVLSVDGGHLTLITAGLNSVTIIVGFAIFAAIRRTLAFDKRLVFAGYRQATLIAAKASAIAIVAAAVAAFTSLSCWRSGGRGCPAGWPSLPPSPSSRSLTERSACSWACSSGATWKDSS